MDWYPLWNSLRIALISCAAVFFLGIFAAYYIAKLPRVLKGVLDVVLTLPMVLPPTVVGYFLLLLFGAKRPLGLFFLEHFGVKLVMNWYSAIFASIVVAFPLMYRTARGAFESFDETLAWSAQTLGLSNTWIFWRVRMPYCRQGILAGTVLAFARALGEYGATSMIAGYTPGKTATIAASAAWALALSAFLQATGRVPLAWWIPCMAAAVGIQYLYLWVTRTISLLEAGYVCARAFVLAELAASAEWQLHCFLWPQRSGADGLSLLLLVVVYGGVFGCIWVLEHKHKSPKGHIVISGKAALVAVVMAAMVFAVSNLLFLGDREVDMSVYYIRTLVDICGVLILTVQHEQLREAALHSELAAMDEVLHRQYEQYKRSKEGIRLINSRYHELKIQIAAIRAERDRAKQDAALARMESGLRQYEAENKTGNPVLDTLLTAKSMDCQQRGINMTSVADGSQLGFLSTRELCTLVGAPLDNAIESVLAEPDPEKRLLRVAIYNQSGCVMLRFENYCAQPVELGADGLPVHNAHGGYDLQGVQAAAQRHDGTMTLHWADGWFTLRILLPVPS